jgi:hypothetical protein
MHKRTAIAAMAGLFLVGAAVLGGVSTASASDGSAPVQVTTFIGPQLTASLAEFYGPGANGTGIKFDSSTSFAATSRIFAFTPAFVAGKTVFSTASPAVPARRLNEWATAVTVDKKLVGVATVAYSSEGGPRLLSFAPDLTLAAALPKIPADAQLVRDRAHKAWGSLSDGAVVPIEAGTTGLTATTSLADYPRPKAPDAVKAANTGLDTGVVAGAITLVLIVVIVALVVLVPRRRRSPLV